MTDVRPPGRSIARNALTAASVSIVRGVLGFAASLVVARSIGPLGQGRFAFFTGTVTVLGMVGAMGVSSALIRAKAKTGKGIGELYAGSLVLGLVTGAVLSLAFAGAYAALRDGPLRPLDGVDAAWVAGLLPATLVFSHWTAVAYLDDRIAEFGRAAIVGAALFLAACTATALAGRLSAGTAIAYWAVCSLAPIGIVVRRVGRLAFRGVSRTARQLVAFGARANVATLALILVWRVDLFIVAARRGVTELGFYSVAVTLAEVILQVGLAFRVALAPLQGAGEARDHLVRAIVGVFRVVLVAGAVLAVAAALLSTTVVQALYGDRFAPSAVALAWLVPGIVALLLQGPLIDYLITEGRVAVVTAIAVATLAVNVALNIALLGSHTFVVAAVASTVSYGGGLVAFAVVFARAAHLPLLVFFRVSGADLRMLRQVARP